MQRGCLLSALALWRLSKLQRYFHTLSQPQYLSTCTGSLGDSSLATSVPPIRSIVGAGAVLYSTSQADSQYLFFNAELVSIDKRASRPRLAYTFGISEWAEAPPSITGRVLNQMDTCAHIPTRHEHCKCGALAAWSFNTLGSGATL